MKLSSIAINGKALTEGVWVDAVPQLPGVRLKVRADRNTDYQRLEAKLEREIPREDRLNGIDPVDAERIRRQCLAETVLYDWEGIEEESGEPMVCTPERKIELLANPDFLLFLRGVESASNIALVQRRADAAADAGN